ncbi:DUF1777-domain-containing protein [Guyanagaster necrorhizus]|uniref:DUF1777-domain-containing protein n=1 Tax=Guyanagaster necrorhizus TaxID=856835 RepID=A0A9P7W4Q7_9AGAR|nr:DUF1777-domain-containing protein [Guyanagaster necrorhizus MCA 3950]KAG7452638.1 DUF1777-domain-containing protein [Guyanagaster necrorhizus MCA 3950]
MSSRGDNRRRDRSWERDSRNKDRYSRSDRGGRRRSPSPRRDRDRSRSPRRDRDRRSRNDYGRDRDDTRRDRERGDRDHRPRDGPRDRDDVKGRGESFKHDDSRRSDKPREPAQKDGVSNDTESHIPRSTRPNLDPDAPDDVQDGAMDDPDEDAMMATMGLGGFGSTKGKHVDGNQEGTANVKKTRTWRQYMNRRGGFNRPLDKIK